MEAGQISDAAGRASPVPLGEIVQETRAITIQGNQVNTVTRFQYCTWNHIHTITYPDRPYGDLLL